jgi:four helix bundle protein
MAFKFQNQINYEQLLIFSKEIYDLTGKLPTYETQGLILALRKHTSSLLENYAVGSTRTSRVSPLQALDNCISIVAKITALIDLCHHLKYISDFAHQNAVSACEDLTHRLYESRKSASPPG